MQTVLEVKKVIFDNRLQKDRDEAVRLCGEKKAVLDIVTHIRPLDTLKVAESPFAKVVKSKDVSWFGAIINQRKLFIIYNIALICFLTS